jgi:hypothetical protein
MTAAPDTPNIALFISSFFPKPRRLSVAVGGPVNNSDADEGDLVPTPLTSRTAKDGWR